MACKILRNNFSWSLKFDFPALLYFFLSQCFSSSHSLGFFCLMNLPSKQRFSGEAKGTLVIPPSQLGWCALDIGTAVLFTPRLPAKYKIPRAPQVYSPAPPACHFCQSFLCTHIPAYLATFCSRRGDSRATVWQGRCKEAPQVRWVSALPPVPAARKTLKNKTWYFLA